MSKLTYRILLVIVVSALALAPLRGALALPVVTADADSSHCMQMQHGMHSMDRLAGMPVPVADNSGHDCQGCGGDCCEGTCNDCAHGSVALSSVIAVTSEFHDTPPGLSVSYGVSGRTIHPPFRPPISLPG